MELLQHKGRLMKLLQTKGRLMKILQAKIAYISATL